MTLQRLLIICTVSAATTTATFAPKSNLELKGAVDACIAKSSDGNDCPHEYGPMSEWDVSAVTSTSSLFKDKKDFNTDISKWNVANVESMTAMFRDCHKFNQDIGKWNVGKTSFISSLRC